jgi:hypothetical protein
MAITMVAVALVSIISEVTGWKTRVDRSPIEVADIIDDFVHGTGQSDFGQFLHVAIEDPKLDSVRLRCLKLHEEHPPEEEDFWCSPAGIEELRRIAEELRFADLDQLMELSKSSTTWVSDVPEPDKIANKCVEVTRTATAYFSRLVFRSCEEEDLESSDCGVLDWRLRYREPQQFHVNQFMSPSDLDEWVSLGPETYQYAGFWFRDKDDSHKDHNQSLLTNECLRILEAREPLSATIYSFSDENFVLFEYDITEFQEGLLHKLLAENPLISPGNIEVWVHYETNFLAKAALIFSGRDSDGKEIHGDQQHVFSGYNTDIRISPPQTKPSPTPMIRTPGWPI